MQKGIDDGYVGSRLLDATGRLLEIMRKHELSNAFLDGLERAIEAERFGHGDDEALRASLDALRMQYAAELRQRFPLQEEKA